MWKTWIVKKLGLVLVLAVVGFGLWTWAALSYVYSSGERAGYVQKFSTKGWLFKTWEGELLMATLPGTIPEKFYFTVRDDAVAGKISGAIGQRVGLKYNEHKGIPTKIFGDTSYFVTEVAVVQDPTNPPTFPIPAQQPN